MPKSLVIFLGVLLVASVTAMAGPKEECTFTVGGVPQFKTSIAVLGPDSFGNTLLAYPLNGVNPVSNVGQSVPPKNGEKFRLLLDENSGFTAFTLNDVQPGDLVQKATIYLQSSVFGTELSGNCEYIDP